MCGYASVRNRYQMSLPLMLSILCLSIYDGEFHVNLIQARVILEEGTSPEKTPYLGIFLFVSVTLYNFKTVLTKLTLNQGQSQQLVDKS